MLSSVPFTVKGLSDSTNYTALTWFTDEPSQEDELYQAIVEMNEEV